MLGRGIFYVGNADLLFKGIGIALFGNQNEQPATVRFQGTGYATFNGTKDYGRASFPSLRGQGFGSDVSASYGAGLGMFPALVAAGEGGGYVPPPIEYGFGFFPALTGNGILRTSSPGEGNVTFPALIARGGEGPYGDGHGEFPALQGYGLDDFFPGQAPIFHTIIAMAGGKGSSDHIIFVNNRGTIVDSITADRELIEQWIEQFEIDGGYSVIGDLVQSIEEHFRASSAVDANIGRLTYVYPNSPVPTPPPPSDGFDGESHPPVGVGEVPPSGGSIIVYTPAFPADTRIWVVNIDTGATSQYDGYGFNSFFRAGGRYYGVADDGVYLLEGNSDSGRPIQSEINTGLSDYGSKHKKRLLRVLVGVASGNRMLLKLVADGVTHVYEAHSNSPEHLDTHGFPTRRDHQGRYLNFTLLNQAGCDFDLESIEFHPIEVTKRY